jgi:PEGA domain
MAGTTMRSARPQNKWIILSDRTSSRVGTDTPDIRGDETLLEFTSEAPAKPKIEAPVTASAGSTARKIAPGQLPNLTLHEHTPTPAGARLHAPERRKLIESLTAHVTNLRARVPRAPRMPMWIGRVRNVRSLSANTVLSFAVGTVTGVLIMWFATAQPPTIVPPATPTPVLEPASLTPGPPASPLDAHSAEENVSPRSMSGPTAIVSAVARSAGRNNVVDQRARSSHATSTSAAARRNAAKSPAAARTNAASSPTATRKDTSPGSYRGALVLRSAPQGARVFVNGALVGSTPLVLENLPVGSRAVRIEADGYQHWSSSTQVVADQETHLSATLAPAAP